ncbi:MAG: hypothetical protein ACLUFI_08300 [Oscillospiraceae bacterium]
MRDIVESGVNFGPYAEDNLFYIEKSDLYKSLGAGIKTTEFVLRANELEPAILFVEAKTNAPNPENRDDSAEKRKKFEEFYTEVPQKFVDSFEIYTAKLMLKRYSECSEIGLNLQVPDLANKKITFLLVITNRAAQIEWLASIKAILEYRLRRWMKTCGALTFVFSIKNWQGSIS